MLRKADKAGSWYQADPAALQNQVEECLRQAGDLYGRAVPEAGEKTVAAVVPHAGLFFSGAVAATAFQLLRDVWGEVDTFVIFGACHREHLARPAIWPEGSWQTPLGDIQVDAALAEIFIREGVGDANPRPHLGDNAIELQAPFIRSLFPRAKILPVAMGNFKDAWRYGESASRLAREHGGTIVAVGSTDLTHYGAPFDLMPAGQGPAAVAWTRENDNRFLAVLTSMDMEAILATAARDHSACGAGAAAAAAGWARERGCRAGRVLAQTNSYEVLPQGEADHLVGYAAVAFNAVEQK